MRYQIPDLWRSLNEVGLAEIFGDIGRLRAGIHHFRAIHLLNDATVQDGNPIRDAERVFIVGNEDGGEPVFRGCCGCRDGHFRAGIHPGY